MKWIARNALLAALYAGVALALPATAFANYRLTTALYVVAAWNPRLIVGLALGNALAGIPQGPVDMVFGALIGALTAWFCHRLGQRWAPLAVLVVPTVLVPVWLGYLFGLPYMTVLPVLLVGQAASSLLGVLILRSSALRKTVE